MEYTVKFNFNCINKRSMVSRKSGEVDITTEAKTEELMTSQEVISLITTDVSRKTNQSILSVEITDVQVKN